MLGVKAEISEKRFYALKVDILHEVREYFSTRKMTSKCMGLYTFILGKISIRNSYGSTFGETESNCSSEIFGHDVANSDRILSRNKHQDVCVRVCADLCEIK